MPYPTELIPNRKYKKLTGNSLTGKKFCLVRFTPEKNTPGQSKLITAKALNAGNSREYLDRLSCNLLGIFKKEHCYFDIKKAYHTRYLSEWSEGEDGLRPNENEFDIKSDRGFIFVQFDDIHNKMIPRGTSHLQIQCSVMHVPLLANYWHMELSWKDTVLNQRIERNDPNWVRPLQTVIQSLLLQYFKPTMDSYGIPDEAVFT